MRYEALAPLYDRLMSHVEYDDWLGLIDRISARFLYTRTPRVFELGGGTGFLGRKLVEKGYRYLGSDYSAAMCAQAVKRDLPFACADARSLPIKSTFDLFIFLYDGINYLQSPQEYQKLFAEVSRCLKPGGFFLFDITTETNSLRHFVEYLDFEDYGDYSFARHSHYDELTATQYNDFTIFAQIESQPGAYRKHIEHHAQKVFPVRLIEEAIPRTLFDIMGIWDGYTFRRYTSRSERIHFLLKRTRT